MYSIEMVARERHHPLLGPTRPRRGQVINIRRNKIVMILSLVVSAAWTTGATTLFSLGTRVVRDDLVSGSIWIVLALAMYTLEVYLWSIYIEGLRA
jgi:hypothetical protein